MRDKEREKDGNEIQWICLIRQDQCTKLFILSTKGGENNEK